MFTKLIRAIKYYFNKINFIFLTTLALSVVFFIFPMILFSANTPLPPTLEENIQSSNNDSSAKTPQYVIIRSPNETVFSSETTGKVISLPVKEGSIFKVDDILVVLDCRLQQADLNKAKAQKKSTDKAWLSAKKLKNYGSISEFELTKALSESEAANADVDKLTVIVEKCTITAPFNGAVSEVLTHAYETVKPGDPLLKVVNTENLTFEVQVPSQWLSWLKIGSEFKVYINDINKTISAKVTLINPEIEPVSQTVKVIGIISPPVLELRPGMTGQAVFPRESSHLEETNLDK